MSEEKRESADKEMERLDMFAASALSAFCGSDSINKYDDDEIAKRVWKVAKAMIRHRPRKNG
jgi:hypothetical protein